MQEPQTTTPSGIDPRNPFDNPTENRDYNLDYSDILPLSFSGSKLKIVTQKIS